MKKATQVTKIANSGKSVQTYIILNYKGLTEKIEEERNTLSTPDKRNAGKRTEKELDIKEFDVQFKLLEKKFELEQIERLEQLNKQKELNLKLDKAEEEEIFDIKIKYLNNHFIRAVERSGDNTSFCPDQIALIYSSKILGYDDDLIWTNEYHDKPVNTSEFMAVESPIEKGNYLIILRGVVKLIVNVPIELSQLYAYEFNREHLLKIKVKSF